MGLPAWLKWVSEVSDTMLTDEIKNSEHYQTFLALSTGLIPPKKSRDVLKIESAQPELASAVPELEPLSPNHDFDFPGWNLDKEPEEDLEEEP
ncbi:hypothetical protein Tco_0281327 [Tanacetum coccineum]